MVYTYNGIPLSHKEQSLPFAWMDLEDIMLSEINQRKRLHDITYMWNLKKYKKLVNITKKQQTHRYREQTSGYQWDKGRREGQFYRARGLRGAGY